MTSIISIMLSKLYPQQEVRALMVGLDSSGRTTLLYKLKLGEVVTTIPTIGFNVETVEHRGTKITFWDVGGCDKIRPLWRHYYQNTQAVMFFVDSNDQDRLEEAMVELRHILMEEELSNAVVLVWANKQDLASAMTPDKIRAAAATVMLSRSAHRHCHRWGCFGCSAKTGDGVHEGLDWLVDALHNSQQSPRSCLSRSSPNEKGATMEKETTSMKKRMMTKEEKLEATILEWLQREDEDEEEFLRKLHDFSLECWDHYTHLRVAWLLLTRHGRRRGMSIIFDAIRNFIEHSPRTSRSRGTTFHETMTYFWVHMVDYAMAANANPSGDGDHFKTFLLLNPQLCDGGMFLHYYSRKLMLQSSDSRTQVVLPDLRPLPSLLTDISSATVSVSNRTVEEHLARARPFTDGEWISAFEERTLPSWGHEARLRLIWLRLTTLDRREALDSIFESLQSFEGTGHHMTKVYFWISMVTLCIAKAPGATDFNDFIRRTTSQCLRNPDLVDKYYSRKALEATTARDAFTPPDIKSLPSVVGK